MSKQFREPPTEYLFVPVPGGRPPDPRIRAKVRSHLIKAHHRNRRAQAITKYEGNQDVFLLETTAAPQVSSHALLDICDSTPRTEMTKTSPRISLDSYNLDNSGFLPVQLMSGDFHLIDIRMCAGMAAFI